MWAKSDLAHSFWFTLRGNMQQQVPSNDGMKLSNTVDEGSFFGYKEDSTYKRNDYGVAMVKNTQIVTFHAERYRSIIKEKLLTTSERKIDFLIRFGPQLRLAGRKMVEEFEVFFIKESYNKGYVIQR